MGRHSGIDKHVDRARIERDIARRVPPKEIAQTYGLSVDQVVWHKRHKMSPGLLAQLQGQWLKKGVDLERLRLDESENILVSLAAERARLFLQQDRAMQDDDHGAVASLGNALLKNIELCGRYLGEFVSHTNQMTVNLIMTNEYAELRAGLVRALLDHPKARKAVLEVFNAVEEQAAKQPVLIDGDSKRVAT